MKTIAKLIMLALVLVFINHTIEAQEITSSEIFNEGDYESSDVSDDGTYVSIAVDLVGDYQGLSKILEKQANGTYNVLQTYDLTKGGGGSDAVENCDVSVSNEGSSYVDYQYGWSSDDALLRLQKNLLDGSSVTVLEYVNDGTAVMKAINGDLYLVFGAGADFESGTLGGLPNLTGGYFLLKINGTSDQYVWDNFLGNDFIWNSDVEILAKPGDNDHVYVTTAHGNLIKFNSSTGANLGIVKTGTEGDKYKFDEDGNLHRMVCCDHALIIYDVNFNYDSILYETDWSQANLWNRSLDDWKIINGVTYGLRGSQVLHLSDDLVHGYLKRLVDVGGFGGGWINNDGTYSGIVNEGGIISIVTIEDEDEDESLIPTLNDSDSDVIGVFNGQTYDGGSWNEAYHQSTIVFEDGTLPIIGSTPNTIWINASSGTHKIVLFPVETDSKGSDDLMFRGVYRVDGTAEDDINIKVILVEESDVQLNNYVVSITKLSDGEEPGTDAQFEINLNSLNNSGSPLTGDITYTGTASENNDYDGISGFSIPNGSSSVVITLETYDDSEVEGIETIITTISNLSEGTIDINTASADLVDNDVVGIDDIGEIEISIYPNPAHNIINISSNLNIEEVQIYNIAGQKICFQRNPSLNQLNVSDLSPGVYFMNILVNGNIITKKFIKK